MLINIPIAASGGPHGEVVVLGGERESEREDSNGGEVQSAHAHGQLMEFHLSFKLLTKSYLTCLFIPLREVVSKIS